MSAIENYQRFDKDGIELVINLNTGETYSTERGYARMSEKSQSTINSRVNRLSEGERKSLIRRAEIHTPGGLQGVSLISEDLIAEWLPKDNPQMATQLLKLGVRMFLYKLAGFEYRPVQPELSRLEILNLALESEKAYLAEKEARELAEKETKLLQGVATELRQEVEHLEEVIEEEAHLVHLSQTLTVRDKDAVTIGELSQSYQVPNYQGRNKFFRLLREIKFLQQNVNRPYQTHIDAGRAEVYRKERDNQPGIFDPVTVVTAKGQEYLAKKIREFQLLNRVEGQVERLVLDESDF